MFDFVSQILNPLERTARYSIVAFTLMACWPGTLTYGQETDESAAERTTDSNAEASLAEQPAAKVEVNPVSRDADITARLERILEATEWFDSPQVDVTEGVVFLEGTTTTDGRREWASKLASNTEDVVAVANRIQVTATSVWDISPAWKEIDTMQRNAIQSLPNVVISLVLLIITYFITKGFAVVYRRIVARRTSNPLLKEVLTKALAIPVVLIGIYLALRVSGLTRLAATVLGGTGLAGLIIGIAFRDIAENFLASLLISTQRPFQAGDTIVVENHTGVVQAVTTRGTTIMTFDGNLTYASRTRSSTRVLFKTSRPIRRNDNHSR